MRNFDSPVQGRTILYSNVLEMTQKGKTNTQIAANLSKKLGLDISEYMMRKIKKQAYEFQIEKSGNNASFITTRTGSEAPAQSHCQCLSHMEWRHLSLTHRHCVLFFHFSVRAENV